MCANSHSDSPTPQEGYVPVENAALHYRQIGQGQSIILLHGGPDFDHTYLLPDMDRLSDSFRLIYYDQRGRGKSAANVEPEDVSIQSEMEDLEALRKFFQLDSAAILGHSWGGVMAMEYAIRHPERVSHLILMDTAPASHEDYLLLRQEIGKRLAIQEEKWNRLRSSAEYAEGNPDAVAEYYRLWFSLTIKQPQHLDSLIRRLRMSFTSEGVLLGRAIEDRLRDETWLSNSYDLLPNLKQINIPTLVIRGDYDFIPADCSVHIAQAIPNARLVLLKDCGHFAYIEAPNETRKQIDDFFAGS
jgi:proline iminopeptidase